MKTSIVVAFVCLSATFTRGAEEIDPTPLPVERYAAMGAKSPFALATPIAPAAAPQASFATNWFISGIARFGDTNFVTVKSRDLSTQFSLYGREPLNGISVASVEWSEVVGKSTVILQKGTETAKLEFNEADLRAPSPSPANPTAPNGNAPSAASPSSTTTIVMPNPGGRNGPAVTGAAVKSSITAPVVANPSSVQRRIRIISQPR